MTFFLSFLSGFLRWWIGLSPIFFLGLWMMLICGKQRMPKANRRVRFAVLFAVNGGLR
jgi:hypothetical protein